MSARGALLICVMLANFYSSTCCELGNITSLRLCVRENLEASRDKLREQVDPKSLQNVSGTTGKLKWEVQNPILTGIGNYSFENLDVDVENRGAIRIKFNLTWSSITIRAIGETWSCGNLSWWKFCSWVTSNLTISMTSPVGSGEILLELPLNGDQVQATHKFSRIVIFRLITVNSVDICFDIWGKILDRLLGFPSKTFKTELSTNYWSNETGITVVKLLSQLTEIADSYLPSRLSGSLVA